jgi:hypothetical protein
MGGVSKKAVRVYFGIAAENVRKTTKYVGI